MWIVHQFRAVYYHLFHLFACYTRLESGCQTWVTPCVILMPLSMLAYADFFRLADFRLIKWCSRILKRHRPSAFCMLSIQPHTADTDFQVTTNIVYDLKWLIFIYVRNRSKSINSEPNVICANMDEYGRNVSCRVGSIHRKELYHVWHLCNRSSLFSG